MFFRFDPQKMEVHVVCGPNEEYKPDEASKELQEKCNALRAKMSKFMIEEVNPGIEEIRDLCNKKNELFVAPKEEQASENTPENK